jgi:hypothetical protein
VKLLVAPSKIPPICFSSVMDYSPNYVYSTKQIGGTRLVFESSFRAGNLFCASYVVINGLFINLTVRVPKSQALEIDED